MPLIDPPTGQQGGQFPQMLYGPDGTVVTVGTAADAAAALQAGFATAPFSGFDYANVRQAPQISYPTFNYSHVGVAQLPWDWGQYGPQGELG